MNLKINRVVFSHRDGLRWYFIDTQHPEKGAHLFLSINPMDIKYLFNGIHILCPPTKKKHIKGNW
jgi:hypothetical protein